jgi:predicted MFS family arabinose efflux permease
MVAAGTALIGACYGFARFSYGLFAPSFRSEFQLGPTLVGVIGAGSYVGYCVAIVASLLLTARLGARPVAVAAGVVATLGTATVAAAPHGAVLAVGVVVAGSSTGLASPPLAAAVARWVRLPGRDRAQTVVNAGTGLGVLLSGPLALLLADSWRTAWATFAVVCAAVTAWVALTVPGAPRRPRAGGAPRAPVPAGAVRLLVAALLLGLSSSAVWTFGRDVVEVRGGAGPGESAALWIVIGAAGLAGAASAAIVGRLGLARAWTAVLPAMSGATLLLALAPGSLPAVLLAGAAFGATYIALTGLVLLWSTELFPDRASTGVGASFLAIAVGQVVGAPLTGALVEQAGHRTAFVVVALAGLAGAAVRPLRPPPRRAP